MIGFNSYFEKSPIGLKWASLQKFVSNISLEKGRFYVTKRNMPETFLVSKEFLENFFLMLFRT